MGGYSLINVLQEIHTVPKALQSDFCRDNARSVARLASLGLITSAIKGSFGNHWRCTFKGLRVLELGEE